MTKAVQIQTLRRQIAGLSLKQLAERSDLPYQRAWRLFAGGAKPTAAEAVRVDLALDVAEAEMADAVRALAVLRGSFSAEIV